MINKIWNNRGRLIYYLTLISVIFFLIVCTFEAKFPESRKVNLNRIDKGLYQTAAYFEARKHKIDLEITDYLLLRQSFKVTLYNISPLYYLMVFDETFIGLTHLNRLNNILAKDFEMIEEYTDSIWKYLKLSEVCRIRPLKPLTIESKNRDLFFNGEKMIDFNDDATKFLKRCILAQPHLHKKKKKKTKV